MKRLVVLGGGESGVGAAILGKEKGMEVFLSDSGHLKDQYKEQLERAGIPYEEGGHTAERVLEADEVVKSPGIPPTAPLVKALTEKGVPVLSEIEFAGRYTDSQMICITGSNGKTTTTMLIHHILTESGIEAGLAGNVGHSLALQVARDPKPVYVIELSSFQLENMYDFKADIAIITNITPDHLDRYDHKMENYISAKFRILQNQTPNDYFIYWKDDPIVKEKLHEVGAQARQLAFAAREGDGLAAWLKEDGEVGFQVGEDVWEIPRDEISLPGLHNLYNAMAAGLTATVMHIKKENIRKALHDFEAVEHRLEYVDTIDGVRYINDSKATNVNSTYYALESMTTPTVLILGGTDKGNDYSEILDFVKGKVRSIVAMGVDNGKIVDYFGSHGVKVVSTGSLDECLAACREEAQSGDTVLLSPCCASFDLFKSYEDRGKQFKEKVRKQRGN